MLDKIFLHAVDEFCKLIDFSECLSRFEPEISRTVVWAPTYLLIIKMDYKSRERKQDTLNIR